MKFIRCMTNQRIAMFQRMFFPQSSIHTFCTNKDTNTNKSSIKTVLKSVWEQTFPSEQQSVRQKFKKVKQTKRLTPEQQQQIQQSIPQYKRKALIINKHQNDEGKKKFKVSNLIPQSIKSKVKSTQSYKQFTDFKENFKEYVQTRDGTIANLSTAAYSSITQGSNLARATQIMRLIDPNFSIFELESDSTVIFKDAYHRFLQQNVQQLQFMVSEQALQYFKAHIKINKVKEIHPKFTQMIHHNSARLSTAKLEKKKPIFIFDIRIMELYCMLNKKDEIVEGDDGRIVQSTYTFGLSYNAEHLDDIGHPWEIVEVQKIQEVKMLI